MKTNKAIFRIIAIALVVFMTVSFGGCIKTYNNDPTVIKCGSVKLGLQKYLSIFYNSSLYQYFAQGYISGENYNNYVMGELTKLGVELDQVKKQGITLTAEEEEKVQQDLKDQITSYLSENYASKIDSAITDETAKYEAELKLFKADLRSGGNSFKKYCKELEQNIRDSALIEKLRDTVIGDITVNNDDIVKYFEDNTATDTTLTSFNSSFGSFFSGSSTTIPGFMPVVKAAETTEEDTESDEETTEPNPYDELFSVQHVLVKFAEEPGADVKDYAAYAAEDDELKTQMEFIESRIGDVDLAAFINDFCHNADVCEDPGMEKDSYQFFGYLMAESLISSYYDGFGDAAMMLKYLDWQPEDETDDSKTEEETPYNFDYKLFTLADGNEVMRMYSKAGVHYIVLNPNDWNCMYDPESGMLRVVLYDGEEPVKDGSSYVTTAGNISESVFNAIQEAFSHIGDKDSESFVETTCKSIYDYYSDAALSSAQNEVYGGVYNEWKENTKIKIKDKVVKAFYSNVG